jgi:hypothetical protein
VKVEQYLQHNQAVVIKEENYFNMNKIGTFFKRRNSLALLLLMFSFVQVTLAQNNSAIVEYASHDRGILIPRMSTSERTNIPFPAEGLIVYDNNIHSFYYFDGTQWRNNNRNSLISSGQEFWPFTGIDNSNFGLANPFLGTNDYSPLIFKTNDIERFRITPDGVWVFENDIMNAGTNSLFANSLTVKNDVYLNNTGGSTQIDGATTIGGPLRNITAITGDLQLDRDLNVDGNTNIIKDLTVSGVALVNNFFTVTQGINTRELTVQQDVILNSNTGTTLINGQSIFGGPLLNQATFKGPVVMEKSLTVKDLVVENTLTVGGPATFHNTILVEKDATLKAKLNVDGATDLNSTLNVDGFTRLRSTLTVDAPTDLNQTLNVAGTSHLRNLLTVDGAADLNSTLKVVGVTTLNDSLYLTTSTRGFLATFSNTNGENNGGDGIKIKLGKPKSNYLYPGTKSTIETIINNGITQNEVNNFKKLFRDDIPVGDKGVILAKLVVDSYTLQYRVMAGLAVSLGNLITKFINDEIGLPIPIGPITTPKISFPPLSVPGFPIDVPVIPTFNFPGFTITNGFTILEEQVILKKFNIVPKIPEIDLTVFNVPKFDLLDPSFWGVPKLFFTELFNGYTMDNDSEFIRFSDKNDKKMGTIRGESILNWVDNFLSPAWLAGLKDAVQGSPLDPIHAKFHWQNYVWDAMAKYLTIGIEYTSGNGDYAEWLERVNKNEFISKGEIVGVIGGKVSKNLENAEQVMVVSHNPIVLGNVPPEGKTELGNNIAFMGQVPVKIIGPVASGDYILGNHDTPGYGIAKSPEMMQVEDFHRAVGRSWEANDSKLPIMANTVIGVHNGDFIKVFKKYDEQFKASDERLKNVESQLNLIMTKLENEKN